MKRLCVVLFLVSAACDSLSAGNESTTLHPVPVNSIDLQDCNIMRIFQRLWKYSPLVEKERAAWIVLNSNSEHESIDWPYTVQRRISIWSEALPAHIVAQAHTHADHLDPKPSRQDANIAHKLNIDVYTLTRKGIWRVTPDGLITQQADRGWFKKTMEKCKKD